MKKSYLVLIIMLICICCCSCGEKKLKAPNISDAYIGTVWEDVYSEFSNAGFRNISTEEIKDLDLESEITNGAVEKVSVNGNSDYTLQDTFEKDVEVVIVYHTLAEYKANIHINFNSNLIFNKYGIDVYSDNEKVESLEHGKDRDFEFIYTVGNHKLTFVNTDNEDVKGEINLMVTSDLEASYTVNCDTDKVNTSEDYIDYLVELEDGQIKMTKFSEDFLSNNAEDVISELTSLGFKNIELNPIYDIVWGVTEDGEMESITIGGKDGFKKGEVFSDDVEIVVTFHTLESNDPKVIAEKKRLEEEEKKLLEEAEKKRLAEEEEQKRKEENKKRVITIDNNEEFKKIVEEGIESKENKKAWKNFLKKYDGATLEFDGTISYLYDEIFWVNIHFTINVEDSDDFCFSENDFDLSDLDKDDKYSYNHYYCGLLSEGMKVHIKTKIDCDYKNHYKKSELSLVYFDVIE